jgi:hypothetical protein
MPIRDRVPGLKDLQFTPLVSYLRFHTGDAMFMGIILRLLRLLDDLIKAARDKGVKANPPWGAQFLSAIKATKWAKRSSAEKKQIRGDLDHWHKHVNMEKATEDHPNQETMWRDVGLIDSFLKGPAPPSWLKPFVPPDKKISKKAEIESFQLLKHTADVATRTVNLILKYELLESLGLALETLPVTTLIDAGALPLPQRKASDIPAKFFPQLAADDRLKKFRQVAARAPLVKAHNFERLRLVFDGAAQGKFK